MVVVVDVRRIYTRITSNAHKNLTDSSLRINIPVRDIIMIDWYEKKEGYDCMFYRERNELSKHKDQEYTVIFDTVILPAR